VAGIPKKRFVKRNKIIKVIIFLVSDLASFVHGDTINVEKKGGG